MNWDWQQLLVAVLVAVLGWLSGIVVPPPRTQRKR